MFKKIFSRGGGEETATKVGAGLGGESTMYYCPEKKRWRERGKEHEEVEDEAAKPPPKMGEMPKPAATPATEEKPATGADALCAIPSAYRNFGAKPPSSSTAPPGGDSSAPPVGGTGFGGTGFGGAPKPAGGTGFGAAVPAVTAAANPNAPRGVSGTAAERREARRAERPKPKPFATRGTAFGGPGPAYAPMTPAFGGDPEGGDEDPAGEGKAPGTAFPGLQPPGVRPPGAMPGVLPPGVMPAGVLPPGVQPPAPVPADDEEGDAENKEEEKKEEELPKEADTQQAQATMHDVPFDDPFGDAEGAAAVEEVAAEVPVKAPEVDEFEEAEERVENRQQSCEFEEAEDGEIVGQIPAAQEPAEEGEVGAEGGALPEEEAPSAQVDDVIEGLDTAKEQVEPETETPAAQVEAAPEDHVEEPKATDSVPEETTEGWGDVDLDIDLAAAAEDVQNTEEKVAEDIAPAEQVAPETEKAAEEPKAAVAADDDGWDDFDDDWGEASPPKPAQAANNQQEETVEQAEAAQEVPAEIKTEADVAPATSEGLADPPPPSSGESGASWVDLGGNSERETPPPVSSGDSPPSTTAEPPDQPEEVTPVDEAAPAGESAHQDAAPAKESMPEEAMPEVTEVTSKEPESAEADGERRQREEQLEQQLKKELEEKRDYMEQIERMRMRMAEMEEQRSKQGEQLKFASEDLQANDALAAKDEELAILRAQVAENKVMQQLQHEQVQQQLTDQKQAVEKREQEIGQKQKESEINGALNDERLTKMSQALKAAEHRAQQAEEQLAETGPASPKASLDFKLDGSPGGMAGDEFNLPDFVWNCGNSQVMEYVQQLCTDNVALKRQMANASPGLDSDGNASPVKELPLTSALFDTADVNVDQAMAFLSTVGDNDGHQIPPLLALLGDHANNAQVCSKVCAALENLTFADTENRSSIVGLKGVEAILQFMQTHQDTESSLLRPAVDALWNITFDDDAVDRLAEGGKQLESFLAVVQKHVQAADLQAAACAVLLNLAVKEQNRWKIVQLGGVSLISTAMQRHSLCEEVLEQGCQALYMLAYHQDIRPIVLEKCGDAATLAASYPHGAGRVQKWGRWLQEVLAC